MSVLYSLIVLELRYSPPNFYPCASLKMGNKIHLLDGPELSFPGEF